MNGWAIALVVYVVLAILTFLPVARRLLAPVELHPGGPSFEDSPWFSTEARRSLSQHFERLKGTLGFWKTQAAKYKAFHTYALVWVTLSTVMVPFLAQSVSSDIWSKWLVTVVGAYAALLLALSRGFRVESNYKAFRHGESDFYDLYRKLLDRPALFGDTESARLSSYYEQVEIVRRFIRTAETDNFPSIEDVAQHGGDRSASASGVPAS